MISIVKNPVYRKVQNIYSIAGIILAFVLVLFILIGFFWTPYSPSQMSVELKFARPSLAHPFGCDNMGRDILSRIMAGSGFTLIVGFMTVLIGLVFGTLIGALTAYYGGRVDHIIMRINDAVMSFPSILIALVVISMFGIGQERLIAALGIIFIPSYVRMVRGEVLKLKDKEFVELARLIKASDLRIIFVHILPNAIPVIISTVAIGFNNAVLAESALSFMGIGVRPNEASLGKMLADSQSYIAKAPWYCMFTGGFMVLLILSFGLISEGISHGKRVAKNKKFKH